MSDSSWVSRTQCPYLLSSGEGQSLQSSDEGLIADGITIVRAHAAKSTRRDREWGSAETPALAIGQPILMGADIFQIIFNHLQGDPPWPNTLFCIHFSKTPWPNTLHQGICHTWNLWVKTLITSKLEHMYIKREMRELFEIPSVKFWHQHGKIQIWSIWNSPNQI